MVREGQWLTRTDAISSDLVGKALLNYPDQVRPTIEKFSADQDFWIRRTSLLAHLSHKKQTLAEALPTAKKWPMKKSFLSARQSAGPCVNTANTEPERVLRFLQENKTRLSPLSLREGAKYLVKGMARDLLD